MNRATVNLRWDGPKIIGAADDAVRNVVWGVAEDILKRANERVPLDEGTLQASGEAGVLDDLVGIVSYNTPYAVRLHENPDFEFQGGREGKWLERTMEENAHQLLKRAVDEFKKKGF